MGFLGKMSQQLAFNRQLSVNAEISTEEISGADFHTSWKMSQNLVEIAYNKIALVKKSQQLELNRQLSVNKDIST